MPRQPTTREGRRLAKEKNAQAKGLRDDRDDEALRLIRAKLTYRQVATELRFDNPGDVFSAVKRARAREHPHSVLERKLDSTETIDLALRRMIAVLTTPLPPPGTEGADGVPHGWEVQERWIKAAVSVVRLEERRARLWGLDAPGRKVIEHHVVTDEALAAEQAQLRDELVSMGVNPDMLPTVEGTIALMRASAIDVEAEAR